MFSVATDITVFMRVLLAPTQTHGYVMTFTGSQHKALMGHYQCFETDHTELGAALNYIQHHKKQQHVYCLLYGRMTSDQKQRARDQLWVNTALYCGILKWFI